MNIVVEAHASQDKMAIVSDTSQAFDLVAKGQAQPRELAAFLAFSRTSPKLTNRQNELSYVVFSDDRPDGPRWACAFYFFANFGRLIERCERSFDEAMDQHMRRASNLGLPPRRVVLMHIECLHVTQNPADLSMPSDKVRASIRDRAKYLAELVLHHIRQKSYWLDCDGLLIVIPIVPFLSGDHIEWERDYFWMSPRGGTLADEFPPLPKIMKYRSASVA